MSEKEIIENAKNFISIDILYGGRIVLLKSQLKFYQNTIQELLDLYNNIKEIEQSHKEENGKLRVELEQEKEKNKELEHEILKRQWVKVDENGNIEPVFYISKNKIKEKIEELDNLPCATPEERDEHLYAMEVLKEIGDDN